jgi:RHS repeat-associated protein
VFGYSGEETDTSGLVFLRARYMQPTLGIFLARDPWSGDQLRPGSMNGFNYAGGNPIIVVDPSGRCYPPVEFLRDVPIERELCVWLDQALYIYAYPYTSPDDRNLASIYIGGWAFSHSALLVGGSAIASAKVVDVVNWASRYLAAREAARFASEHPNAIAEAGQCVENVFNSIQQTLSDAIQSLQNQQYVGFTPEESTYINQVLTTQPELPCHSATLCSPNAIGGYTMVPDPSTGSLYQDPSFKLVGEYGPDVPMNNLRPGDLLTYYAANNPAGPDYPIHSDRVLKIIGDLVQMFDKPTFDTSFGTPTLEEVLSRYEQLIKVLVYRR